jgi:hypothetical protein
VSVSRSGRALHDHERAVELLSSEIGPQHRRRRDVSPFESEQQSVLSLAIRRDDGSGWIAAKQKPPGCPVAAGGPYGIERPVLSGCPRLRSPQVRHLDRPSVRKLILEQRDELPAEPPGFRRFGGLGTGHGEA